jgi:hypothetical protein
LKRIESSEDAEPRAEGIHRSRVTEYSLTAVFTAKSAHFAALVDIAQREPYDPTCKTPMVGRLASDRLLGAVERLRAAPDGSVEWQMPADERGFYLLCCNAALRKVLVGCFGAMSIIQGNECPRSPLRGAGV